MLVRLSGDDARDIGRNTQGVRLISVREGDQVIGAEKVESAKDEDADAELDGEGAQAPEAEGPSDEPEDSSDSESSEGTADAEE